MSDFKSSSENPIPASDSPTSTPAGEVSTGGVSEGDATVNQLPRDTDSETGSPFKAPLEGDSGEQIRQGSPFAVDPQWDAPLQPYEPELFLDVGPLKYTAMGAVAASAMVVLFASAAAYWFPGGGTLIAGLGSVLAIFGLYSHYRLRALLCLIAHLVLFMVSYGRALG